VLAALSNWLTTGDHLGVTLLNRNWIIASLDLCLLGLALLALVAVRKLQRSPTQVAAKAAINV
jgi:hypothetical protein